MSTTPSSKYYILEADDDCFGYWLAADPDSDRPTHFLPYHEALDQFEIGDEVRGFSPFFYVPEDYSSGAFVPEALPEHIEVVSQRKAALERRIIRYAGHFSDPETPQVYRNAAGRVVGLKQLCRLIEPLPCPALDDGLPLAVDCLSFRWNEAASQREPSDTFTLSLTDLAGQACGLRLLNSPDEPQLRLELPFRNFTLDLSHLLPGTYTYRLEGEGIDPDCRSGSFHCLGGVDDLFS